MSTCCNAAVIDGREASGTDWQRTPGVVTETLIVVVPGAAGEIGERFQTMRGEIQFAIRVREEPERFQLLLRFQKLVASPAPQAAGK